MSALDQAFIRAYIPATNGPADEARAVAVSEDAPCDRGFRAAFQVDRFAWSPTATRLALAAGIQLDRLADGLAAARTDGRKVVGLGACCRSEGCTTLVLCAARRLAARGLNVLLIDADFRHPCLARRLGLLPQIGWEDVLAGRAQPAEALVESIEDRLTVLPLRGLAAEQDLPARKAFNPAATVDALRPYYDLILVDLGELGEDGRRGQPLAPAAVWLDAIVLVHNVRCTPQAELTRIRNRLHEAGLIEAGIAENFV